MELMNVVIFRKYELLVKGDGKVLGICNIINNYLEINEIVLIFYCILVY